MSMNSKINWIFNGVVVALNTTVGSLVAAHGIGGPRGAVPHLVSLKHHHGWLFRMSSGPVNTGGHHASSGYFPPYLLADPCHVVRLLILGGAAVPYVGQGSSGAVPSGKSGGAATTSPDREGLIEDVKLRIPPRNLA